MNKSCQLHNVPKIATGEVDLGPMSLRKRVWLTLKRRLSSNTKRRLKRRWNEFLNYARRRETVEAPRTPLNLQAGDLVRVRSADEIRATLNAWGELRGCAYMSQMWSYCGTVHRVKNPVRQFLDERDYRIKKMKGVVLLDDTICQGMEEYGPCDRSCFFFWREEWLEKPDHD